jgi:hypothetical protein
MPKVVQHGRRYFILWVVLCCILPFTSTASHVIAVEIRAKPIDCSSKTYEITVIGYVSSASGVNFGGDEGDFLFFGDGDSLHISEIQEVIIDPLLQIGRVEFKVTHTYPSIGRYILSYRERNRNEGILNMEESGLTVFYTESSITISEGHCDSSPHLTVPPVDRACSGVAYYHNPGTVDPDDDSLSFSFVAPQSDLNTIAKGYLYPHEPKFYSVAGIPYNQGNENNNGPPGFNIDPIDGTMVWDAPGAAGQYAFAIKVISWRYHPVDSAWFMTGFSIRDMMVVVEECVNNKPDIITPSDLCVIAGTAVVFDVPATDPDSHPVSIEAFSEAFSLSESPAEILPTGTPLQSTAAPYDTASLQFRWQTNCLHAKAQPYNIVFKVTDSPPAGPRLVRFKTVSIKVIAPPPEIESVNLNPVTKNVTLEWKDYPCENVEGIQIWRRVAQYDYNQPECNTGMPYFLRYILLTTLPGEATTYTDSDLSIGVQYCYRIVALNGNNKISSRISLDTCLIPKPVEAPVITNVSVIETDELAGSVEIRWTSPFDIDKNQYPPPYMYKVFRSTGFRGGNFTEITESPISDTVYIDTGRDTHNFSHEYKIELFVPTLTTDGIDTSSVASSVFLEAESEPNQIKLTWEANTPWYNFIQHFPFHLIYRSDQGPAGPFILIDSVDVNEYGMQYVDSGKFQNNNLIEDHAYYYKVLTRGSYGNPSIVEPLENFSKVTGNIIRDVRPPCTPVVVLNNTDCSTFDCNTDSYYNRITWSFSDSDCVEDGLTYRVFASNPESNEFVTVATVSENSFQHDNLTSLAHCYTVAAIDRFGNISDQSDSVCSDNCPYFELPNVFTPGSNDDLNEQLIAYGADAGTSKCARFVKEVDLTIYNRWGMKVYSVYGATAENNYIFWDGLSNSGNEVDAGVYYYSANVTFDVRDPAEQRKVIKGWVHVIRNH